jgi:hypothetical protein
MYASFKRSGDLLTKINGRLAAETGSGDGVGGRRTRGGLRREAEKPLREGYLMKYWDVVGERGINRERWARARIVLWLVLQ